MLQFCNEPEDMESSHVPPAPTHAQPSLSPTSPSPSRVAHGLKMVNLSDTSLQSRVHGLFLMFIIYLLGGAGERRVRDLGCTGLLLKCQQQTGQG